MLHSLPSLAKILNAIALTDLLREFVGFKEEVEGYGDSKYSAEFGVVQDADRLDAIGAIGKYDFVIRCCLYSRAFLFGMRWV